MATTDQGLIEARLAAGAAAIAGDSATLYHLVSRLMAEGLPFETILYDVLVPTEQDVGRRWQSGDYLVAEEHAATATFETVVSMLAGALDRSEDGRQVVLAAAEGDQHSLAARLVAAHLHFLGYRVTFLGANVLASDLGEYLAIEPPDALVLSCAMSNHLLGARAAVAAAHSVGTPTIAGGRGFGESGQWAGAVGADAWASGARQVPEILDSWDPDPVVAEAGASAPTPTLESLVEIRRAVLASAQSSFAARSLPVDARVRDELSILLGAVEASLFVDDDGPAVETLAWQSATLEAHGIPVAEAVAASLREALDELHPIGGQVLARSLDRLA